MSLQPEIVRDMQGPSTEARSGVAAANAQASILKTTVAGLQKPGFNYSINAFRGVCVLLVFFYHVVNSGLLHVAAPSTILTTAVRLFSESWRYGVELFFMISGYVIVASLRRHRSIGAFLRDRCMRIFPVWIPVHIGLFAIGALTGWKIFHDLNGPQLLLIFFSNLLLIPPLLPIPVTHPASWSLSYEWLFYLTAAAAFALATARKSPVVMRGLWMAWTVVILTLLCLIPRALFFLPGVIVACGWLPRWWVSFRWPSLSMIVFLFAWRLVDLNYAEPAAYSILAILASTKIIYMLIAFTAGLHLFAGISEDRGSIVWLRGRAIQFLGTVSYSFYLWHPIVMFVVKKLITTHMQSSVNGVVQTITFATVSFAVALVISWLSYRFIEQGLAKALRRILSQRAVANTVASDTSFATVLPARMEGG